MQTQHPSTHPPIDLTAIARQSMLERDLAPDFPPEALKQADQLHAPAQPDLSSIKDMRNLLWFSLDNDNSKDLDQLTYAESTDNKHYTIYIAVADVDSLVKKGSPIDLHAAQNMTTVYTPTKIFSMLPEKLSTNLTSLNENEDRLAIVIQVSVDQKGSQGQYEIYPAVVRNHAKLAYNGVSAWLDGIGPQPDRIAQVPGMEEQVRLQDTIAQLLKNHRHLMGALTLQTIEPQAILKDNQIVDIVPDVKNRGRDLIEDFMIAANTSIANFLKDHQLPSLRRVVRIPKRWDRIVAIALEHGEKLPPEPDVKALESFLCKQRAADPLHFPDLSLTIIKLLGNGEYVVQYPGDESIGHFGLALKDYTHSTAPNRRYPDLITQRMVKSVEEHKESPYAPRELEKLAAECTKKEDDAEKVERKMKKSAAIVLLFSKINQTFDGLVTGAAPKGTWVRIIQPPVEGKLVKGFEHLDVGDRVRVKLVHLDLEKGFIDFVKN